jgi:hypothetical protein
MRTLLAFVAAALGLCGATMSQQLVWPKLPTSEFVAGRAATIQDVEAGRAVFVAQSSGIQIGKPLSITIPQYAWHNSNGKKTPVVVIQAEEANGQKIVGAKTTSGSYLAGLLFEFELLGSAPPK